MADNRTYARIAAFIYALAIAATIAVVFLALPFAGPGYAWISLAALLIAESTVFGVVMYFISNRRTFLNQVPGYVAYGMTAAAYFAVTVAAVAICSVLSLSLLTYGIIHLLIIIGAAIMLGIVAFFVKYMERQDETVAAQAQFVKQLLLALLTAKQHIEGWNDERRHSLQTALLRLEDKARYSDPVSHPDLQAAENLLLVQARELQERLRSLSRPSGETVDPGTIEEIGELIRRLEQQLEQRNQQLVQLK